MRRYRRKSDGLFLFMTKKHKLRALNRFREALNENNQSKMYEYYLFYDVQMENTIRQLQIDLLDFDNKITNKIKYTFNTHNQLERGYTAILKWLVNECLDSIIDSVENEND